LLLLLADSVVSGSLRRAARPNFGLASVLLEIFPHHIYFLCENDFARKIFPRLLAIRATEGCHGYLLAKCGADSAAPDSRDSGASIHATIFPSIFQLKLKQYHLFVPAFDVG
jgi:hypothetical protein